MAVRGRPKKKVAQEQSLGEMIRELATGVQLSVTAPNIHAYTPHPKQRKFHGSIKTRRLYIGGNRSGKTVGAVVESIWWCTHSHPYRDTPRGPVRGRVVTVDFLDGLYKILKPLYEQWVPLSELKGGSWDVAWNKELKTLTFKDGSFIEFMSYEQEVEKFAGTSRHFIYFDEEPPEEIYKECMARLIDTGGSMWMAMTPVEGMQWIYDKIYEPGINGAEYIDVIVVSMLDNPFLNQSEVNAYLSELTEDEIKVRRDGKFVQRGGLVFPMFTELSGTIRDEEWMPPVEWFWAASMDHGFTNPTAWLWHAVDPDENIYTFWEYYKSGCTIDVHARNVLEVFKAHGRPPDFTIGDPSIQNRNGITGTSTHEEYMKFGLPIVLGDSSAGAVNGGIIKMARLLTPKGAPGKQKPKWFIHSRCKNLIWELQRYRWATYTHKKTQAQHNEIDTPRKKDDHAIDSARYFIMSRPDLRSGHYDKPPESIVNPMNIPDTSFFNYRVGDEIRPANWRDSEYVPSQFQDEMLGSEW